MTGPSASGGAPASSRGRSGPRSWSQYRTGPPSCRIAVTFAVDRAARRAASSSPVRAPGRVAELQTTVPARRATTGADRPPGRVPTGRASPPRAGRHHSAVGGSSSVSPGADREARNSRSPSGVNAASCSSDPPRVSRRAGRAPSGSISQSAVWCRVPSVSRVVTPTTSRVPSGESTRPEQRGRAVKAARSWNGVGVPEVVTELVTERAVRRARQARSTRVGCSAAAAEGSVQRRVVACGHRLPRRGARPHRGGGHRHQRGTEDVQRHQPLGHPQRVLHAAEDTLRDDRGDQHRVAAAHRRRCGDGVQREPEPDEQAEVAEQQVGMQLRHRGHPGGQPWRVGVARVRARGRDERARQQQGAQHGRRDAHQSADRAGHEPARWPVALVDGRHEHHGEPHQRHRHEEVHADAPPHQPEQHGEPADHRLRDHAQRLQQGQADEP